MNINRETVRKELLPNPSIKKEDVTWYKRKRYFVVFLQSCGLFVAMMLRLNLSITVVELTYKNATRGNEPEYSWNSVETGFVLSAFAWGYAFSSIGGILASRFGGTLVFGLGIVTTSILTMLTPFLIRLDIIIYIAARICEGLAESFSFAASTEIILYWVPPQERSRLTAFSWLGAFTAFALAYPLCGFIARFYGWERVFYVTGGISMVWFIIWWALVSRTPETDRFISKVEKEFIIERVNLSPRKKLKYPWKKILKSAPLLAYLNERFVEAWSLSFTMYCLPLYVKDMQNVNIDTVGYISGLPHTCDIMGLILSAYLLDYLRNKQIWSISRIHKTFIGFAQVTLIILMMIMIIFADFTTTIICICLFRAVYSMAEICYFVLPNDMGLQYSSLILGMATTTISIGYMLNPIIVGLFVRNHTAAEWTKYFIFLCCLNVWGAVIFCIFGNGKVQSWAISEDDTVEQKVNSKADVVRKNEVN